MEHNTNEFLHFTGNMGKNRMSVLQFRRNRSGAHLYDASFGCSLHETFGAAAEIQRQKSILHQGREVSIEDDQRALARGMQTRICRLLRSPLGLVGAMAGWDNRNYTNVCDSHKCDAVLGQVYRLFPFAMILWYGKRLRSEWSSAI